MDIDAHNRELAEAFGLECADLRSFTLHVAAGKAPVLRATYLLRDGDGRIRHDTERIRTVVRRSTLTPTME